ncbi:hypothetical protein D3C85_1095580 [compost metagenome]
MLIRERQAIETHQFYIHLRQLRIATDQLFDGSRCRGAVVAGGEGSTDGTGARRHADAGSEHSGEKGCDRFHVGVTRITVMLWDLSIL